MRFLRQSLTGIFLAALSIGLVIYAAQMVGQSIQARLAEDSRKPPARERVFAVNVTRAVSGTEVPVLEAFGQVQGRRTLEVRATASGRVVALSDAFEDGGIVAAGDVLVQIDPADARAALERAEADLEDAKAEVREAEKGIGLARDEEAAAQEQAALRERAYKRQVDLADRGVGTAALVEDKELAASSARQSVLARRQATATAEARFDQAQTRLRRTEIALAEAERALEDTTITAPFSGQLSGAALVEGRLVAQNEKLADLIDPKALDVSFRVSAAQYARLLTEDGTLQQLDLTATLVVSGMDLGGAGRITRSSAAVAAGQTGRVVFGELEPTPGFQPGDFVTVGVREKALDNVVRLPASAYDADGTVLVLGEEERLEAINVRLVRRQGNDVLVRGRGLDGREVVTTRTPLLGEGIKVRPLRGALEQVATAPEMLELTDERRAKLVAFVEGNSRMPAEAKARVLARLSQATVPARMVERIESQMGS